MTGIRRIERAVNLISQERLETARRTGRPKLLWVEATEARDGLAGLWELLDDYLREVAGDEFEVGIHAFPVPAGGVRHPVGWLLSEAFGTAVAAEAESDVDLIIYNDWAMPVLPARGLLKVPVTGISEASVVIGNVLARRPAIVTVAEGMRPSLERDLHEFGLLDRMARPPVWWLDPPTTHEDVLAAVERPGPLIDRFDRVAARAVDAGADAILVGCGYYGPVFARHGYSHVRGRPDVPVYDCTLLGMEFGRMLHRLHRTGTTPSGRGFAPPSGPNLAAARHVLAHLLGCRPAGEDAGADRGGRS